MKIEYPLLRLRNAQTGIVNTGYSVGNYLMVTKSKSWEIWSKHGNTLFRNIDRDEDAIRLAEWLREVYEDYFLLWDAYTEADIFRLSMWSVPDGRKNYEVIEKLRICPKITFSVVQQYLSIATGKAYYQPYINIELQDSRL